MGLSFVLVQHPHIDMDLILELPFGTSDPRDTMDLSLQYAATEPAARRIVHRVLDEEEKFLYPVAGGLHLRPVKEEH